MNMSDWIRKLEGDAAQLDAINDKAVRIAALDTNAKVVKRVFNDGNIPSKRQYKSESYKKKRAKRGFQTAYVNLTFEGTLVKDFANSITKVGPAKYVSGVKNRANVGKVDGANDRYNNPFNLTDAEKQNFTDIHKKEFISWLSK